MSEGEVVCPPPQSSQVRGRLSPTSVLPHKWGRKMLQHANSVMASGCAHLTRLTKLLYKNRTNLCLLTLTVICLNRQQMKVR